MHAKISRVTTNKTEYMISKQEREKIKKKVGSLNQSEKGKTKAQGERERTKSMVKMNLMS